MTRLARRIVGGALAVAATVALVGLSRVPYPGETDSAVLRMSWRVRGEQVEQECRRPTAEELEELPSHMRNPDACVGELEHFVLTVEVDGDTLLEEELRGAGARGDRPIYVFREVEIDPGTHRVVVSFRRPDGSEEGGFELRLEESVELAPAEAVLVTLDEDTGALTLKRAP